MTPFCRALPRAAPCRHLDALRWVETEASSRAPGAGVYDVFNFGTGRGSTVFELVHAMERASGQKVALEVGPRRPGDLTASYADPSKVGRMGHRALSGSTEARAECRLLSVFRRSASWAGVPSTTSTPSAPTLGSGNPTTQKASCPASLDVRT